MAQGDMLDDDELDALVSDDSDFYGESINYPSLSQPSAYLEYADRIPYNMAARGTASATPATAADSPHPPTPETQRLNRRQPDESPAAFVKRLPPSSTPTTQVGPWIWTDNPHITKRYSPDIPAFTQQGQTLLRDFLARKKAKTDPVAKLRDDLATSLRNLATANAVTSGKWMLFPSATHVDAAWLQVVEGTAAGTLGTGAKVSPLEAPPSEDPQGARLICVYTRDFADVADIRRVLYELERRGLVTDQGRGIFYKADAWTYLELGSGNAYGVRASMYSSADMLKAGGRGAESVFKRRRQSGTDAA